MRKFKNENREIYKQQEKTAWFALASELPNLIASIVSSVFANTLLCWADTVTSFDSSTHCLLLALLSRKMKDEKGDQFNYGLSRLEVFSSFLCDSIALSGMIIVLISSVIGLFVPRQPSDSLLLFLILKGINISFDFYFLFVEKRIFKKHASRLNESEFIITHNNLISDTAVGVVVCICYLFRHQAWVSYLSPVSSILMAIVFLIGYTKHIAESAKELTDYSLPAEKVLEIQQIVEEAVQGTAEISSLQTHQLNRNVFIDLSLDMNDGATVANQKALLHKIQGDIARRIPDAKLRLTVE